MSSKQKPDDINAVTAKPFSQKSGSEKLKHVCKVLVFFVTFGFAFPNIFTE